MKFSTKDSIMKNKNIKKNFYSLTNYNNTNFFEDIKGYQELNPKPEKKDDSFSYNEDDYNFDFQEFNNEKEDESSSFIYNEDNYNYDFNEDDYDWSSYENESKKNVNNIDKKITKNKKLIKNFSSDFKNTFGYSDTEFKNSIKDKYCYKTKRYIKVSEYESKYNKKYETKSLDKSLSDLKDSVNKLKTTTIKSLLFNPSEEKIQTSLAIFKDEYEEITKYLKSVNYKRSSILYKKFKISSATIDELYTRFLSELRMSLIHNKCLNSISKKEDFIIDYSIMYFNITELKIPLNIYYKIKKITADFKFITI